MKKHVLLFAIILAIFISADTNAQIITTVAGGAQGFSGDGGQATAAAFEGPDGVAIDDSGNIYISDQNNQRVRKITATSGIINTIAGDGFEKYSGDGGQATAAELGLPTGLAIDKAGNLYIADRNNNRIRKITKTSGIITTVAGDDSVGYHKYDDGRPADSASLFAPTGVAVDDSGNVYIADLGNSLIRKVSASTQKITTIAGIAYSAGYSGDGGQATTAKLFSPADVALDDSDNIYISDNVNSRLRKITKATGIINTIAGDTSLAGFSGDGGPATSAVLDYPFGLTLDNASNVYFADEGNNRIRKIDAHTGIITTLAGGGHQGLGDGGAPDSAGLNEPIAVAFDDLGNLYIADQNHDRIREVIVKNTGINSLVSNQDISVYPNPGNGRVIVQLNGDRYSSLALYDLLGRLVYKQPIYALQQDYVTIDVNYLPGGMYVLQLISQEGISCGKIEVQK